MAWRFIRSSSQWVDLESGLTTLNNRAAATLCAWVKMASQPATFCGILEVSTGSGAETDTRAGLEYDSTFDRWYTYSKRIDGGSAESLSGGTATTDVWKHVAAVFRWTTQSFKLYQNAVQVATASPASWTANCSATNSQKAAIASEDDGSGLFLDGWLADVRIYSRALSVPELEILYQARSRDSIIYGLEHRWQLLQMPPGGTPAFAWDRCHNRNGQSKNTPNSTECVTYYRRRAV